MKNIIKPERINLVKEEAKGVLGLAVIVTLASIPAILIDKGIDVLLKK